MRQLIIAVCMTSLGIMFGLPLSAQANEQVSISLYLNSEDKGDFLITLTDEGKVLFTREDLLRLGIKEIPADATIGEDGYISLSPQMHAQLDKKRLRLQLTVEPELLGKTASEPEPAPMPPVNTTKRVKVNVQLNGKDKGEYVITLSSAGKILFVREELLRLGINELPNDATTGKDGYVSLSPHVQAVLDEKASILYLTVVSDPPPAPSPPQAAEQLIANVFLNREDKGDFFIRRTNKGKILFAHEDLLRLGIEDNSTDTINEDGFLPLPSTVQTEFDEKASILYLTLSPDLLGKTTIDLARKSPAGSTYIKGSSGFINYGLSYSADEDLKFTTLSMPLEMGITTNGYLGLSSFSYNKNVNDERFIRLMTSVVKDEPAKRTRFIAGDFSTSSGMLGSGGLFGGLSFATKFALDPYSLHYPGAELYGVANTPSDVEVYVNGLLVGKEHVSPGEFEFLNVGNARGSGEATLVITDAYGREERITTSYYASAQLLKPGIHDYSYSLGYQREAFGQESNEYGDAAFLGYHRLGISKALTAGLRAEADADIVNGGVNATFLLGTLGEFDTSLAYSREGDFRGNAWSVRYSRASRYVSGGLFARGFSRDYSTLMMSSLDDKSRLEANVNLGFRQKQLGSVSLFYSMKDMYQNVDRKRYGINYSRRLGRQASLSIVAAHTVAEQTNNEIFANLMIMLGESRSANVAWQKQGSESAARVSLQQNAPLGKGYGYRISGDRRVNGDNAPVEGGDAYLQYRGQHGIYSAQDLIVDGTNSYTVGTAGGIAFINRSAYFTRPIHDGFVLAKVGSFENVAVSYNNQEVGVTDEHGELLVPGLISYYRNNISINDKNIPVNYELSEASQSVSLPYRAGGIVQFDLKKLKGFTGQLVVSEHGRKTAAEYWGLRVSIGADMQEVVLGKKGAFYLENLPAGHHPAQLFRKDETCSFELSIPESDEVMVNIGEVICEKR